MERGKVKLYSYFEKQPSLSQKVKTELPYNPAILLIGICSREMKTNVYTNFIVALFLILKEWGGNPNAHQLTNGYTKYNISI